MILKFRLYDIVHEEMEYFEDYKDLSYMFNTLDSDSAFHEEPMQSTGLLDINGKEIYEGDIVHIELIDNELDYVNVRSYLGQVIYDDGVFDVKHSGTPTGIIPELYLSGHNYQIKLLGNIYENKELMEEFE